MGVLVIRTILCALIAAGGEWISERLIHVMLKKRNKELEIGSRERLFLLAVMIIAGAAIGYRFTSLGGMAFALILLAISLMVGVIDWHFRIIPNGLWEAIMVVAILFAIPTFFGIEGFREFSILQSIIGYVVCFIIFSLPGFFKKNVGAGDIKLAAAIGFALGVYQAMFAIVAMGLLVIAYIVLQRKAPILQMIQTIIPMGPFIAAGMMAVLLWIA